MKYYILHGGSWDSFAIGCRTAHRCDLTPVNRGNLVGFRLIKKIKQ
jgi:formylglycine-generating enzyme required for sulfatase activity